MIPTALRQFQPQEYSWQNEKYRLSHTNVMFSQLYTQKNKNKYLVYEWEYHNISDYKIRK